MKKLSTQIWVLIVIYIVVVIAFMYVFTDYLYERLYVEDSKAAMIEIGGKLQTGYRGGKVTDDFVTKIEDYNAYSNYNVFAVRNPRELSACVPFEIDYDALIGPEERQQLLQGSSITKMGYEERFERQIISVILPLTDQNRLEGIIYIYYPLAKISELANEEVVMLIGSAASFSVFLAVFIYIGIVRIMRPLKQLQHAVEKMSKGDYETRVFVSSKNEIGKLSEAFNEMAEAIQKEDENQKTFLATVSHELRTPISYVKGYSEAIESRLIEEEKREEAIQLIVREANRMERLTNELLQLARVSSDLKEVDLYPIVLSETVRDAMKLLENQAMEKDIELQVTLDENIIVQGNEEKLKRIFINLIENAIRYSDEKSMIQITTKVEKQHAMIEVLDHGIGIPKEDIPHITERFYRVNKARSRMDGGSGLGLSIVESLLKQLKGSIEITSELGKGTVVTIRMPLMEDF